MIIRRSSLSKDGSGKDLSDGWVINFAVGCTHGCLFCYVDRIWRLHSKNRLSPYYGLRLAEWGQYLYVPGDLEEQIKRTSWQRWSDICILMSSTHDPYLPKLYWPNKWPRRILELALPHGVRFTILTRSTLPVMDFDLYAKYREQILLMASIPTLDGNFARITEPQAPPPVARFSMLKKAKRSASQPEAERPAGQRATTAAGTPFNRRNPQAERKAGRSPRGRKTFLKKPPVQAPMGPKAGIYLLALAALALAANVTYITTPSGKIHITYVDNGTYIVVNIYNSKVITANIKLNVTTGGEQYFLHVVGLAKGYFDNATINKPVSLLNQSKSPEVLLSVFKP